MSHIDLSEFPPDWKGRKTYVHVNGAGVVAQCYTYWSGGYKLLPEYGGPAPETKASDRSFQLVRDISPYRSVETGEVISSRSQHREHIRTHGLIEVGNERLRPPPERPDTSVGETIKQTLDQLRSR